MNNKIKRVSIDFLEQVEVFNTIKIFNFDAFVTDMDENMAFFSCQVIYNKEEYGWVHNNDLASAQNDAAESLPFHISCRVASMCKEHADMFIES